MLSRRFDSTVGLPRIFRGGAWAALAVVVAIALSVSAVIAQQPTEPGPLTAEERQELFVNVQSQMARAQRLRAEGKLPEAIEAARQALELEHRLFPKPHPALADTLVWLAKAHESRGEWAEAKEYCRQVVEVTAQLPEADRWRAADARCLLKLIDRIERLDPSERAQLEEADQWIGRARQLSGQGKAEEAIRLVGRAVDVQRRLLGENTPRCAAGLDALAAVCQSAYDYAQAERAYRQAMEIREATLGPTHPEYLTSLNNLGLLYHSIRDHVRAEPLLRRALEVSRRIHGPKHPDSIWCLNNLAEIYQTKGDYAEAEPLLREALEACKEVRDRWPADYASALNNLAGLYASMGDYTRAEPLLREALEIRKAVFGPESPAYAASLNNLAGLCLEQGDFAQAESRLREALDIRRKVLDPRHPDCATTLDNLAAACQSLDKPAEAEKLYREAMEIRKQVLGTRHPDYALSLNNLAALYRSMGDYERAEPLYQEALETREEALGTEHADYAVSLNNLAVLYRSMGDYARSEPLYRKALDIQRRLLQETFAVLSERQQLDMTRSLRRTLDGYLSVTSVTSKTDGDDERSYGYVLAWKGMVFVRQRQTRLAGARPELAPLVDELQSTASGLAALVFSQPDPSQQEVWRKRVAELSEKKERIEAELARRGAPFSTSQEELTAERLRTTIPPDTALVDFLEYAYSLPAAGASEDQGAPKPSPTPHLAAFLVRPDRPVARVDLGPVEPIRQAIDAWRSTYGQAGKGADAAMELRRRVWAPLEEHLGDVATVLVSPDGDLARFPLAALPGKAPGTYLLEERALAVVPVPQWLPEILAEPATATADGSQRDPAEPSLLLLGDIDYDAPSRPSQEDAPPGLAATRNAAMHFDRLDSSRGEILAVRDSFELAYADGEVRLLRQHQATEAAFRREVPRHRFLHVATHGFFAPPEWSSLLEPADDNGRARTPRAAAPWQGSGLAALHPGLLSGLALAGANTPVQPGADDGILTADEVASLNLGGVDLAVLSACETGLGPVAGGEGVLGLQRAFQVSGARSVVATLWKVSDEATRQLMERFYENLWDRKMPKLEALRQAQLAMLREGPNRGMALVKKEGEPEKPRRVPPYYWAAFVLSGDWR
ncbi:MAG TPA: CHAT domain-containing tetratricopeptide repeat protein [Thermoguttaceae bacterium]|nr:CHAT domain-containing tetratricopeptide repeat protein [Thermoguttaceae bacterium]